MVMKNDVRLAIEAYIKVTEDFVFRRIRAKDFETAFLETRRKHLLVELPPACYSVIHKLFDGVDRFCENTRIADYNESNPHHNINSKKLLELADESLIRLREIIPSCGLA